MQSLDSNRVPGLIMPLRDHLQRLAPGRLRFGQRGDAFIQRGQRAAPAEGETEQIGIRHLLMTAVNAPRQGAAR